MKAQVMSALKSRVGGLHPTMARVSGYHHGWLDQNGAPTQCNGGKALRSAMALLSARAAGAELEAGVPAAVAVEMVHNFSLLHDDIMDGDTERRHRATAWTVFGTSQAILAGDALLIEAVGVLLDQPVEGARPAARRLSQATTRLITGQTEDLSFERRTDVTLAECRTMAGNKTGALFACAAAIGAELVGGPPALVDALAEFGEQVGLAFQLVDDLLGIWGSPEQTGKPVLSDLRSRKKSLPVVAALANSPELAALYFRPEPLDSCELRLAADLIERAGGRSWAEQEITRLLNSAGQCLSRVDLRPEVRDELMEVAQLMAARNQ